MSTATPISPPIEQASAPPLSPGHATPAAPPLPPASTRSNSPSPTPTLAPSAVDEAQKEPVTLGGGGVQESPNFLTPGGTRDFKILPIPKRLRWDPDNRPQFPLLLNIIFGFASTFCVASLYYPQPILITLADELNVTYDETTNIPTILQAAYAVGLVTICPMGDLVRRRPLLLLCVASAAILSLILALVPNLRAFQAISFFIGMSSVTSQILLPLAADLARPEQRALAFSIVMSGLLLGLLFARVVAGLIAEHASVATIYYMSFGLLTLTFQLLYWNVPDYPAKNPHLSYFEIIKSMVYYACTEPVLIQACLIGGLSSAVFSTFWLSLTFVLGELYGYPSGTIGLFALVGILGVFTSPLVGKAIDGMVPWLGIAIGLFVMAVSQAIWTGGAAASIGAVVVTIFLLDVAQQLQQVSNSVRIFAINPPARARFSAVFIFSIFIGQIIGTAAGTRVYLAAGYHASGAFCLGLIGLAALLLLTRSPHRPTDKWFGYSGGWELRKKVAERKRLERERLEKVDGDEKARGAGHATTGAGGGVDVELQAVGLRDGEQA